MPAPQPKVPQAGLEFIRDMTLDDCIDSLSVKAGVYHSGECLFEKVGKKGAWICEFVIEPGPEAKRIILTQQAGGRHPVIAAAHKAIEYSQIPNSVDPHRHVFAAEGEALSLHDTVTAILQLSELATWGVL